MINNFIDIYYYINLLGRLIEILNSFKTINQFTEDAMKLSIA